MECLQGDSESGPSFQHSYVTAWLQLSSLPLRKGQGPRVRRPLQVERKVRLQLRGLQNGGWPGQVERLAF